MQRDSDVVPGEVDVRLDHLLLLLPFPELDLVLLVFLPHGLAEGRVDQLLLLLAVFPARLPLLLRGSASLFLPQIHDHVGVGGGVRERPLVRLALLALAVLALVLVLPLLLRRGSRTLAHARRGYRRRRQSHSAGRRRWRHPAGGVGRRRRRRETFASWRRGRWHSGGLGDPHGLPGRLDMGLPLRLLLLLPLCGHIGVLKKLLDVLLVDLRDMAVVETVPFPVADVLYVGEVVPARGGSAMDQKRI
mmetsp:Transcript_33848/g.82049  ORF Transcript_33848/g.82049 Transcript_33848/m.82049 type:complete len:247 (+) Transcript_33848:2166-2906(+)